MIQELSVQEFMEKFSEEEFLKLSIFVCRSMIEQQEFKNSEPFFHSLLVLEKNINSIKHSLTVEAIIKKINKSVCDFNITKLTLSDQEMPYEILDRYNELKKIKIEIEKTKLN